LPQRQQRRLWGRGEPPAAGLPTPGPQPLLARDKISLDLFWLKDESLLDSDNLPEPDVIAAEIAEDLRSALEQMEEILGDLEAGAKGLEDEPQSDVAA
jgi:type I restriction enzyme M protein